MKTTQKFPHQTQLWSHKKSLCFVLAGLLQLTLIGCATPYVAKTDGPTAKLRMVTTDGNITIFSHISNASTCPENKQQLAHLYDLIPGQKSEIKMLGTADSGNRKISERLIEAESPFLMEVDSSAAAGQYTKGYICTLRFSFTPKAGSDYEMKYSYVNNRCSITLNKLSASGASGASGYTSQPLPVQRQDRTCFKS